jgi:hypothetical protein
MRRSIRLSGTVDAVIEVNGRGDLSKYISVNDKPVDVERILGLWDMAFHFDLDAVDGPAHVCVTVEAPLGEFRRLSLTLDGVVVYSEERSGRLVTIGDSVVELPLPIEQHAIASEQLPRIAESSLPVTIERSDPNEEVN